MSSSPSSVDSRAQLRIERTWNGEPIPESEAVDLQLIRLLDGSLRIDVSAPFHNDLKPPGPPGPTDGLWDFEVVELFIVGVSGAGGLDGVENESCHSESLHPEPQQTEPRSAKPRYTEIELSPHGHHLVLRLEGVRQVVERCLPLDFSAQIDGERWQGSARLEARFLPRHPWLLNAFAIHGERPRRFLAHSPLPGSAPDFHQPRHFPPFPV